MGGGAATGDGLLEQELYLGFDFPLDKSKFLSSTLNRNGNKYGRKVQGGA